MNKEEQNLNNAENPKLGISVTVSVSLFDTLAFAEWIDINCVRNGEHKWTYRGNNFQGDYTTEQLYRIYYNER